MLCGRLAAQDSLYKRDGTVLAVKLIEVTQAEVKYKRADYTDGPTFIVSKSELLKIRYANGSIEDCSSAKVAAPAATAQPTLVLVKEPPAFAKNIVYAEFGGNGGLWSLNYERLFQLHEWFGVSARVGYSYAVDMHWNYSYTLKNDNTAQTLPVSVSALFGHTYKLEAGIGYTPAMRLYKNELYDFNNYVGAMLGYRYQNYGRRSFFFKGGVVVAHCIDPYYNKSFPSLYLGWGLAF